MMLEHRVSYGAAGEIIYHSLLLVFIAFPYPSFSPPKSVQNI